MIYLLLSRFRLIDITVFTLIAVIIDIVIGVYGLFGIRLYISVGIPIIFLLYLRWGKYALLTNVIIILVHFLVHYVNIYVMFTHSIGLFSLSIAIFLRRWRKLQKKNIEFQHIFFSFFILYAVMFFIEWFLLMLLNQDINILVQLLNHSLNLVLSVLLLFFMSKQNDLLVNMNIYLQDSVKGE